METDLHKILKSDQELGDEHTRYFIYHILRALKYIHSANIVHRDLKPSNILVNADCSTKICDFGLSRPINEGLEDLTEYVVTRFYRAPEIMLSSHEYTKAVDIWSLGCTLGEILARRVLFPGNNYIKQVDLIVRALGTPSDEDMEFIANPHAKRFLKSMGVHPKVAMTELIGQDANEMATDLLGKMLEFNPMKRITVDDALRHSYLEELHDSEDEPVCDELIDFSFETQNLSFEELKQQLIQELEVSEALDN